MEMRSVSLRNFLQGKKNASWSDTEKKSSREKRKKLSQVSQSLIRADKENLIKNFFDAISSRKII